MREYGTFPRTGSFSQSCLRGRRQTVVEPLESRRLLTTYTFSIPSGHAAAYLTPTAVQGQVDVRLDSPTASPSHHFTDISGFDIIDCGSNTNFLFVDQVPAAYKPTGNTDSGIKVLGGSGGTLRVEAAVGDTLMEVLDSTSISATIRVTDSSNSVGITKFASGVNHLTLRTSDYAASNYYPNGGTRISVPRLAAATHLLVDTGAGTYDTIDLGTPHEALIEAVIRTGAGHDQVILSGDGDDHGSATVDFSAADGTANELGLGNTLDISFCTVTLAQLGGVSHEIVVDHITVNGIGGLNSVVIVEDAAHIADIDVIGDPDTGEGAHAIITAPSTVDDFELRNFSAVSVEAPTAIGAFTVNGTADFTGAADGSTIDAIGGSPSGIINVHAGAGVTVLTPSNFPGSVNVVGTDAAVLFKTSQTIGVLNITDGGLATLQARAASPTVTSARTLRVNSIDLESASSISGRLDLRDNNLIVDYSGGTVLGSWNGTSYSGISGLIASSYNFSAWDGNGIATSMPAATDGLTTLGLGEAADAFAISGTETETWNGQTVDATCILVKYTYAGDLNFDGIVDAADYGTIDNWVQFIGAYGYHNGDFNYDGVIDATDYGIIDNSIQLQGPPL